MIIAPTEIKNILGKKKTQENPKEKKRKLIYGMLSLLWQSIHNVNSNIS